MRRSLASLVILLLTIPVGLAARYAPLGMPWFFSKYLGSALWAVAVYWLVAALLPRLKAPALFAIASCIAIMVELSRLYPEPHIDAFRRTLAGQLLLGRYFSVRNIVAYLIAIALASLADTRFRR